MGQSLAHLEVAGRVVAYCHERWDGRGYPAGLREREIPLPSRIILACDAYEAMVSDRPYRRALGHAAAGRELRENAGSQFDPAVVAALVATVETCAEVKPAPTARSCT